jgi:hypothetical protein
MEIQKDGFLMVTELEVVGTKDMKGMVWGVAGRNTCPIKNN